MKKTKRFFALIVMALSVSTVKAQIENPVSWSFSAVKKSDKVYSVTLTATIDKQWHIYSQTTPEGGPVPTSFTFKTNPLITLDGKVTETGKLVTYYDKYFGVNVKYFGGKVVFTQTVVLKAAIKTNITGTLVYEVCNDEKCLPAKTVPFDIKLQ